MAVARTRRGRTITNYWPGYVDMLSTLLLVVTFLMSLFMLSNLLHHHSRRVARTPCCPASIASSPS